MKGVLKVSVSISIACAKTAFMLGADVCFLLDAKEEHELPSIAPVLRAYSK